MKQRSFITAAIVSTAALAAQATTTELFHETFDGNTGDWSSSSGAASFDNTGWTCVSTCKSKGAIKIGTGTATGSATTPLIPLESGWSQATITVTFQAAAWYGKSGNLTLSKIESGVTNELDSWSLAKIAKDKTESETVADLLSFTADANSKSYSATFTVSGDFTLTFATTTSKDPRAYLDEVLVVGEESSSGGGGGDTPAGPTALDAPTELEASSITDSGFTLTWTAVANADSYAVEVLDELKNQRGSVSGSVSPSGTVITGLSSDTAYTARVKALPPANSEDYAASEWFEIPVITALAGGLVRSELFHDTFDKVLGTSWSNSGNITNTDEKGWTWSNAIRGPEGIRLGTGANPGSATTREIAVSNNMESAEVAISFLAASYSGKTTAGTLTLSNTLSGATTVLTNLNPAAMSNEPAEPLSGGTEYSFTAPVPAAFTLRFESLSSASDKRLLLDSIKVTQVYNPNLTPLDAPVVTAGEATDTSLAFSWGTVTDATGYAVELRDDSGARVGYDAAFTGTATNFTDLAWDSDYTFRVKALGDDSVSCNSPWSEGVAGHTLENVLAPEWSATAGAGDAVMAVVSNKTFSVSAERDDEPLAVAFGGLSPAASGTAPTFSAGTFSWTPAVGDEGKTFTATFTTDSGSFSTNIVFNVLARPALVAPTITTNAVIHNAASVSWDTPPQIRAASYAYRLWSGSDTATDTDVDQERFHDHVDPVGWVLSGTDWLSYVDYPVKFDNQGDYAMSKLYPTAVTNLAFKIHKPKANNTPTVKFYGSTGSTNDLAWVEIASLESDNATTEFSFSLRSSDGYRRFKWVYEKVDSTVSLGSVAAKYEGAGAKFKAGSASEFVEAPEGNVLNLTGLRSGTSYFLEVKVMDGNGVEKTSTMRFSTLSLKPTVMAFR